MINPERFFLEPIEIELICYIYGIFRIRTVISLFRPDVHHETDREQVEIRYRNPDLHAPQEKQRRGQLALGRPQFFLAFTSVKRLLPHSSKI